MGGADTCGCVGFRSRKCWHSLPQALAFAAASMSIRHFLIFNFQFSISPRALVFRHDPALRFRYYLFFGFPFVVAAAGLSDEEDAACLAQVLVAHLQHVEPCISPVLLFDAGNGEDEVGEVGPVGAA